MKRSCLSRSTRKDTNKYDCQMCNQTIAKTKRLNQIKKGMIHVSEN